MNPKLPVPAWAVLNALRLNAKEFPNGLALDEAAWSRALAFADRTQLTLALRARLIETGAWDSMPAPVRERLDRNLAGNTERLRRVEAVFAEIADRFTAAGLEFLTLKGLSHFPAFVADPRLRVQYDIDLYCPCGAAHAAQDILLGMGYEPITGLDDFPIDHLPTMIRKTGWRWRGDFFDPEIPISVDLHFRLWDFDTERLAAPGLEEFWRRRVKHSMAGRRVFQFELADQLGYAALHAVRHLLRGSLRLFHIYEIACFLENRKGDAEFWARWRSLHPPQLRLLESIAFRLAVLYFGSATAPADPLPAGVEKWFERYAWSPVEALFRPNKDELYLHLSLLAGVGDKWRILRRRLLPMRLPGPAEGLYVPEDQMTVRLRIRKWAKYAALLTSRLVHHARVLLPALWGLARWRGGCR